MHTVVHSFIGSDFIGMLRAIQSTSTPVIELGHMRIQQEVITSNNIQVPAAMRWFHFIMSSKLHEHDVSADVQWNELMRKSVVNLWCLCEVGCDNIKRYTQFMFQYWIASIQSFMLHVKHMLPVRPYSQLCALCINERSNVNKIVVSHNESASIWRWRQQSQQQLHVYSCPKICWNRKHSTHIEQHHFHKIMYLIDSRENTLQTDPRQKEKSSIFWLFFSNNPVFPHKWVYKYMTLRTLANVQCLRKCGTTICDHPTTNRYYQLVRHITSPFFFDFVSLFVFFASYFHFNRKAMIKKSWREKKTIWNEMLERNGKV